MHALIFADLVLFLSTLSLRRATPSSVPISWLSTYFYPRSPCGERLYTSARRGGDLPYFYPRSPCGERQNCRWLTFTYAEFLSTLSLRRATSSPDGSSGRQEISIHALLAESDGTASAKGHSDCNFYPRSPCGERLVNGTNKISTVNFYPRSPCGERQQKQKRKYTNKTISIHALLAESDRFQAADISVRRISIHALLAESDPERSE